MPVPSVGAALVLFALTWIGSRWVLAPDSRYRPAFVGGAVLLGLLIGRKLPRWERDTVPAKVRAAQAEEETTAADPPTRGEETND